MRDRIRRGRRRALACALALGLAPVVGLPTGPAAALCPCADWAHFCERQGDGEGRLSSIVFCCVSDAPAPW